MMKKNKLYTINKRRAEIINRPVFIPKEENLFAGPFGSSQMNQAPKAGGGIGGLLGGLGDKLGGVMGGGKLAGSPMGGLIGGLGSAVGGMANNLISGDYKSGAGSAISGIGSTVGSAISNVNPVLGGIVSVGSGIIGGAVNALFGQSVDEEALKQANEGTAAYNNFTSNAGTFDEIKGPEAQANVRDVYEDGLFGGDADEKNEALRQQRRDARQWAGRSVDNNIFNLQQDQMNNALANFSAFGGPINTEGGAIDYGFIGDYLTMKKQQNDIKNKMVGLASTATPKSFDNGGYMTPQEADAAVENSFTTNVLYNSDLPFGMKGYAPLGKDTFNGMYSGLFGGNRFAIGGDLQKNGGDYSVGKIYDISEKEANRLKAMGYEFTVIN